MFNLTKFLKGLLISQEGTYTPKEIEITPGGSDGTKTSITTAQTKDVNVIIPDIDSMSATDTLVTRNNQETLTKKTLTSPVVDTPDINGGTIDGAIINSSSIGATTPSTGNFTSLDALNGRINGDTITTNTATQTLSNKDITNSTINNTAIGNITPSIVNATGLTANFATVNGDVVTTNTATQNVSNKNLTDSTINNTPVGNVTPSTGSFTSLSSASFSTSNVSITGGTIDNTPIGNTIPSKVKATTLETTGDAVIQGNLTVNGTTTTVNSQTLEVADANVVVNKGGNDVSAEGAGLTVDRLSTDGSLIFKDASPSKWAAGLLGFEDNVVTETVTQTLSNKTLSNAVLTDPKTDTLTYIEQAVLPTTPAMGSFKTYFRNGLPYYLDSNGTEQPFSSGGGGGGNATSTGTGDDLIVSQYLLSFNDLFTEPPTDANSSIDITAGKTDPTTYNAADSSYKLNYDSTKVATITGVDVTINDPATFIVKVGDVIVLDSQFRSITLVNSPTSFVINSSFPFDVTLRPVIISQAVYTKDINNLSIDGLSPVSVDPSNISDVLITYEDSNTPNDIIPDNNSVARIAYSVTAEDTTFSDVATRKTSYQETESSIVLQSPGNSLKIIFFSALTGSSGSVNLLEYKAYFHKKKVFQSGLVRNQAYGFTDNVGGAVNVISNVVVGGKTRITFTFSYPVGVNLGTTNGSLSVYLNGQKIPRFIDPLLTPDASYTEVSANAIELNADYSGNNLSYEIVQDVATIDVSEDNSTSIAQLRQTIDQGFQPFLSDKAQMVATTTAGTPVSGKFYSTITNRASMVDPTLSGKLRFGVERVSTSNIYQLQDEFGPLGEPVWSVPSEPRIRFVGSGWTNPNSTNGVSVGSTLVGDFLEVTFYGTGLNLLILNTAQSRVASVTINGNPIANFVASLANSSGVLNARNYNPNVVTNVVSGLTLGVHTAKITMTTNTFEVFGFEILNERSNLLSPASTHYAQGKTVASLASTTAYQSGFTNILGTAGNKGGRVLVYKDQGGNTLKDIQYTDVNTLTLTNATHTNEEVARTYNWREFGANRADDFSGGLTTTPASYAFTLEDGTTTLVGNQVSVNVAGDRYLGLRTNGGFIIITFVGTGLDIVQQDTANGGTDNYTYQINGGATLTFQTAGSTARRTTKVVSGLPYGTHTVRISRVTAATFSIGISDFIIYQPKTPTLPSGMSQIATYNLMANYIPNVTVGLQRLSTGILRKQNIREFTFVGAGWSLGLDTASDISGFETLTLTNGNYFEYTFFGVGFNFRWYGAGNRTASALVQLQSLSTGGALVNLTTANFPTVTTATTYPNAGQFNLATGVLNQNTAAAQFGSGLNIDTLPLGLYKVRVTNQTANILTLDAFDVITPIYSPISMLPYDQQNSLPIGSNALQDLRAVSPVKDVTAKVKNISQAVGIVLNATTSSTVFVPMPDMSVTHLNTTGRLRISYTVNTYNGTANVFHEFLVYFNGVAVGKIKRTFNDATAVVSTYLAHDDFVLNVATGTHKVDIYWRTTGGTAVAEQDYRNILVEEI